jgi:putative endopeptidase
MRLLSVVAVLTLCFLSVSGQESAQHSVLLSDIDKNANPCSDFYEYANGAWRAQNPIPPSMPRWSRRWAAGESAKTQLKDILDEVSKRQDWPTGSIEQLIGDYYGSCIDESRVNKLGMTPIQPLLADIDKMKNTADVQRMIRQFHDLAIRVPFGVFGSPANHNPTQTIAEVFASGLGLPDRDYYVKPEPRFHEAREKYKVHVANIFKLAGYNEAQAKSAADTVFAVETQYAQASLDNVALRDPQATDHLMTFDDLRKLASNFDWTTYFQSANLPRADLNVDEPKFVTEFNRQLKETSLQDWKTYLKWHLLHSVAGSLSDPFVQEDFGFYGQYLSGAKEIKPRWKRCAESTDQLLGEALGKKYVEKYFPPEAKARMQELVKNLLAAMHDTIEGLEWMGPETKKKALEKLATFNPKIGYPDKWKDYSKVKIRRDAFWPNVVAGRKFNVDDNRFTIGKPTDRGRWGMTPPTSDAYYNPLLNEIVFPAGILQPPAFDMNAVDAVNYGAIGVVIGHEISHGFDDQGAQFDAEGRLNNWWTADDLKRFQQRTSCVVNQFESYYIEPNIHHNGKLVLGESIGDLAETQRLMVQGDPHPIAKYRVIGPLSNLPEFANAFSCKQGSEMVRPTEKRCEVW